MMKRFLLFCIAIAFHVSVQAQDIIYTISGELDNQKVPLDSILVENLSNNTWITFNNLPEEEYYQINLTKKSYWGTTSVSSISSTDAGFVELVNTPGKLVLGYERLQPININVTIFNLNGQKIYSSGEQSINAGNSIRVKLAETGIYFVRIESELGFQAFKGVGIAGANNYGISVESNGRTFKKTTKSGQTINDSDFQYSLGDSLRISVFKKDFYADPTTSKLSGSDAFNFAFDAGSDSTTVVAGNLSIEDVSGFDLLGLSVQSINATTPVRINGTYQVENDTSIADPFPIMVTKGDEVIFGFFPDNTNKREINLDDIVLFYLSVFPDIIVLELSNSDILTLAQSVDEYSTLLSQLENAFNSSSSPLDNPDFIEQLHATKTAMVEEQKEKEKSAAIESGVFEFTIDRSGKVTWPEKAPITAAIGMEIRNVQDNTIVFGPHLLKPTKVMLSLSSWVKAGLDKWVKWGYDFPNSYQLPEGEFVIAFTNGNTNGGIISQETFEAVENYNTYAFAADLIYFLVPLALKEMPSECYSSLFELVMTEWEFVLKSVIEGEFSFGDWASWMYNVQVKMFDRFKACNPLVETGFYLNNYLWLMKKLDVLNNAETIANLSLMVGDFYLSGILGQEIRSYYDGISFGELKSTNISPLEFYGEPESLHKYKAGIQEKITSYTIDVGLVSTEFKPKEEWKDADKIPFKANTLYGDAVVNEFQALRTAGQIVTVNMTMGIKDSSEVKIEPAFRNSGINPEVVKLYSSGYPLGSIEKFEGDSQLGEPKEFLKNDIKVRALDSKGNPMKDIPIEFYFDCSPSYACGGILESYNDVTDDNGIASTRWALGEGDGIKYLKARVKDNAEITPVEFTATAEALVPTYLEVVESINNQVGDREKQLDKSIQVIVKDQNKSPFKNAEVKFYFFENGFGSVSPTTNLTNSDGIAETNWTLGITSGQQRLKAEVNGYENILPVTIYATTTPPVPSSLEIVSGQFQTGEPNKYLPMPIKVLVKDEYGLPYKEQNVDVKFTIDCQNCGTVDNTIEKLDGNGNAETKWKLGSELGKAAQKVKVSVVGYDQIPEVVFESDVYDLPNVNTFNATDIKETEATLVGNVVNDGGADIIQYGFYYSSTNNNPGEGDSYTSTFTIPTTFSETISNLTPNTTYYFRAYAKNTVGTGVGDVLSFKTEDNGIKIGDFLEGGIVFYIDSTGQHGLVCALEDQARDVMWGCDKYNVPGADGTEIGTGEQNTADILAANCQSEETAAQYASGGGWFLPSIDELREMGGNQLIIEKIALENGGSEFEATFYYSSTETSSTGVAVLHFHYMYGPTTPEYPYGIYHGTRVENNCPKWRKVYNVRAVKKF